MLIYIRLFRMALNYVNKNKLRNVLSTSHCSRRDYKFRSEELTRIDIIGTLDADLKISINTILSLWRIYTLYKIIARGLTTSRKGMIK